MVDGLNPLARTNVAPAQNPPRDPHLFAFSYTESVDSEVRERSFVVAGAGELVEGRLDATSIVRRGDVSEDAMREKAAFVVEVMNDRLAGLDANPNAISQANVYSVHPIDNLLRDVVGPGLSATSQCGIHWYPSRPPVEEIEFEMDLRGVNCEVRL